MPITNITGLSEIENVVSDIRTKAMSSPQLPSIGGSGAGTASFSDMFSKKTDSFKFASDSGIDIDAGRVKLNSGDYIKRYEDYYVGTDNNERLAQQQSVGDKWYNGLAKLGLKTGTAVLGGTVGTVDSLITGIATGSLSEAFNSGLNKSIDDLNTRIDYALPNLYTKQDQEASFIGQLGQANFYADKVLGGVSFTAGALISEGIWAAATGGTSLLAKGALGGMARWSAKALGSTDNVLKAMTKSKAMAKTTSRSLLENTALTKADDVIGKADEIFEIAGEGKKAATRAFGIAKIADVSLTGLRSAGFESSMEARQFMKETEETWLDKFKEDNKRAPTPQEYIEFKNGLTTAGNLVFGANLVLVGGSNIVQFNNLLFGKSAVSNLENSLISRNLFGVGFNRTAQGTMEVLNATKAQKIAGKVWGVAKTVVPESQEEMGQSVINNTANNYILSAYSKDNTKSTYGLIDSFNDAIAKTYGTKEGWTEGLIGGMVGIVGAGINKVGGGAGFNEIDAQRVQIENQAKYHNNFTIENHLNNVIANNKIQTANANKEEAIKNGDFTGEVMSDTASALAVINRNFNIDGVEEGLKDFELMLKATPNAELAQELGFENEQQAEEFKNRKFEEYKELTKKHVQNLKYVKAMVGNSEVAGLPDKVTTNQVIDAMAYSLTMGEKAIDIHKNLTEQVVNLIASKVANSGATDAMLVGQVLDLAEKSQRNQLTTLNLKAKVLNSNLKNLLNKQVDLQKVTDKEDNTSRKNRLVDLNSEIIKTQEELDNVNKERQLTLDAIGVEKYVGSPVTVEMLDKQQENVSKLKTSLEAIKNQDPQTYSTVKKFMNEQSTAIAHVKQYQKTSNLLLNPETRLKLVNGWLTKITSSKYKLDEGTAKYFSDVVTMTTEEVAATQSKSTENSIYKEFKKSKTVDKDYTDFLHAKVQKGNTLSDIEQEMYDTVKGETVDDIVRPDETSQNANQTLATIEQLKNKVKELLSENSYLVEYFGTDTNELKRNRPTKVDTDNYSELLSKINRKVAPSIPNLIERDYKFFKGELGLTEQEFETFKNLNKKLNDWKTLDGAGVSELLELIDTLETESSKEETKTAQEDKDYRIVNDAFNEDIESVSGFTRGLQTPTIALVSPNADKYTFSHINIGTFISFFNDVKDVSLQGQEDVLTDEDLVKMSKKEGNVFVIQIGEESLKVTVNKKGGLSVDKKHFNKILPTSNILIKDFGGNKFLQIHRRVGDTDTFEQVRTDFEYNFIDSEKSIEIDEIAVNSLKSEDLLDLYVDLDDAWNDNILNDETLSKEEKIASLQIYAMKEGTQSFIGVIPRGSTSDKKLSEAATQFKELRELAFKEATKKGAPRRIKVSKKVEVYRSFIGNPNITIEQGVDGEAKTKNNSFTKDDITLVEGTGFIKDGEVTTNAKIDSTQFITKVSSINKGKKIPFVVFKVNGRSIAFPIDLKATTVQKRAEVEPLITDETVDAITRARLFVEKLKENNLNPSDYNIDYSNDSWQESTEAEKALQDLDNVQTYADIDYFASKEYNKANLESDATIALNISDKPFATQKLMIRPTDKKVVVKKQTPNDSAKEIIDVLEEPIQDINKTLDLIGKTVISNGVIGILKVDEGGKLTIENDSQILEVTLEDSIIEEYIPARKDSNVTVTSKNTIVVNGTQYKVLSLNKDKEGTLVSISLLNTKGQKRVFRNTERVYRIAEALRDFTEPIIIKPTMEVTLPKIDLPQVIDERVVEKEPIFLEDVISAMNTMDAKDAPSYMQTMVLEVSDWLDGVIKQTELSQTLSKGEKSKILNIFKPLSRDLNKFYNKLEKVRLDKIKSLNKLQEERNKKIDEISDLNDKIKSIRSFLSEEIKSFSNRFLEAGLEVSDVKGVETKFMEGFDSNPVINNNTPIALNNNVAIITKMFYSTKNGTKVKNRVPIEVIEFFGEDYINELHNSVKALLLAQQAIANNKVRQADLDAEINKKLNEEC